MMILRKNSSLTFLAIILLLVGSVSTIYVHATYHKISESIIINNGTYSIANLFSSIQEKTIILEDENITGIPLDEIIRFTNLNHPERYRYTIRGDDGYQKTIPWMEMTKGILTIDRRACFSDLPHAFWVRNIIEIEVN